MKKTISTVKLETVVWINAQLDLGVISPVQAIGLIQSVKDSTDLSDLESVGEEIHRIIKSKRNKNYGK